MTGAQGHSHGSWMFSNSSGPVCLSWRRSEKVGSGILILVHLACGLVCDIKFEFILSLLFLFQVLINGCEMLDC